MVIRCYQITMLLLSLSLLIPPPGLVVSVHSKTSYKSPAKRSRDMARMSRWICKKMAVEPGFEGSAATTTGSLRSDGCVLPTGVAASSSSSGSHVLSSGVAEELSEGRLVMNGRSVGDDLNDAGY